MLDGAVKYGMPKMVLGVGAIECAAIRARFETFKHSYPRMQLLACQDIADLEPKVALMDGAWRPGEIVTTGTADDYCAVDFQALSESFSTECVRMDRDTGRFRDRQINQLFGTAVSRIRTDGDGYVVNTNRGPMLARSVVVCAGCHSLLMAQEMGFGLE